MRFDVTYRYVSQRLYNWACLDHDIYRLAYKNVSGRDEILYIVQKKTRIEHLYVFKALCVFNIDCCCPLFRDSLLLMFV